MSSKKNITVLVNEAIGSMNAISTDEGNLLFQRLDTALGKDIKVTISFKEIKLITTAFLNAAFGQLYAKYESEKLNSTLEIIDITDSDLQILKKVTASAKEYFKNREKLDKLLKKELGDDY